MDNRNAWNKFQEVWVELRGLSDRAVAPGRRGSEIDME